MISTQQKTIQFALNGVFCFAVLFATLFPHGGHCADVVSNPNITGLTLTPSQKNILSGQAVYFSATVQGTGDFDRSVTWSLAPGNAGAVTATGLFISSSVFTGAASVTATSQGNTSVSATAEVSVSSGSGVLHVDKNNTGSEDGSALHPYNTVQEAVGAATPETTIKVAKGQYEENVTLGSDNLLLLGGFVGGTTAGYLAGQAGDFSSQNRDRTNNVTIIESPTSANPVVSLEEYPDQDQTWAIDGFTITKGSSGIDLNGSESILFFVSHNRIVDNGALSASSEARQRGITSDGIKVNVINNYIGDNEGGFAGGLAVFAPNQFFRIENNIFEDNRGGGDHAGAAWIEASEGLFTKNVVRGNTANVLHAYGWAGGLLVSGANWGEPDLTHFIELSYNIYTDNECKSSGGGVFIDDSANVRMKHELIYKNRQTVADGGGAGLFVDGPNTHLLANHCTIAHNTGHADSSGNGIFVTESDAMETRVEVHNSILWGNTATEIELAPDGGSIVFSMTYSTIEDLYAGAGNKTDDPLFYSPGNDDYHLRSKVGRYDPGTQTWVKDAVHSPCIDGGQPTAEYLNEPSPNGRRANMGVYGNTYEASMGLTGIGASGAISLLLF